MKQYIEEVVLVHSPTSIALYGGGGYPAVAYADDIGPVFINPDKAHCARIIDEKAVGRLMKIWEEASRSARIGTLIIRSSGSLPAMRRAIENYREELESFKQRNDRVSAKAA